ncbi:MAG: hypothetical protein HY985_12320 [Magnetospirillum sp.]|nr:hypothetical protein [Magnetospirillum sp.]
MNGSAALVRAELEKAVSLVGAARRLLATGTMVDLAALEAKVRFVCETVAAMEREDGRRLVGVMEALIADLDGLAAAIHDRQPPLDGSGVAG